MDSTIWTELFPEFGVPYRNAISTINKMIEFGYEVIIWTSRSGDNLRKCIYNLIDEHGLNPNVKVNDHSNHCLGIYDAQSQKIAASIYIDDKAYGAPENFEDEWLNIYSKFIGEDV